jgi:4-amino-4-deoxy-L-arabinose transferase-like glycosyltransferase
MAHDSNSAPGDPGLLGAIGRDRFFWGILGAATLWKLLVGAELGLIFDECYYWVWALHPQACYFDHPPLVAWSIAAGRMLLGHTELAVRLGAILSGIVLALAGRALAGDMFGRDAGNRAGIFLILAPVFAGNAFLMTPDTWLAPAWALALLFAWRGSRETASMLWWMPCGGAAGIGLLGKYTMVLFFGGLGLVWILSPGRRVRIVAGSLIAGITALAFFSPVIWWNSTHGWASFGHQLHHGFYNEQSVRLHLDFLTNYALFLIVLVSPVLGLICFRSAAKWADGRFRFLAAFFWVVVAFFGYAAIKAHVEANWPMMAFVSGLILAAGDWNNYSRAWRKAALIVLLAADLAAVIALSLLLAAGKPLLSKISTPPGMTWVARATGSDALAGEAKRAFSDLQAKLSEITGPRDVAQRAEAEFLSSGADFLCADTYQTFGVLSFYAPGLEPFLWLPIKGRTRFPWIDERQWTGKNGLTVEWPRTGCNFGWLFRKTLWTRTITLPGIARPITLTANEAYEPSLDREE